MSDLSNKRKQYLQQISDTFLVAPAMLTLAAHNSCVRVVILRKILITKASTNSYLLMYTKIQALLVLLTN